MNNTLKELNRLGSLYLSGDFNLGPYEFLPLDPNVTGVTIVPQDENAFDLAKPVAGYLRPTQHDFNFESKEIKSGQALALCRILVGHTAASRWSEDRNQFIFNMMMLINQGLRELYTKLGLHPLELSKYIIQLEHPAVPGQYFRDNDDSAAYEVRLVVLRK